MTATTTTEPSVEIPTFLPGKLLIEPGTPADYLALARFHYLPKRPATWAAVWTVRHVEATAPDARASDRLGRFRNPERGLPPVTRGSDGASPSRHGRLVAVAVLSYPTVNSAARDAALGLGGWTPRRRLAFVNAHVRTVSRVVVHPQYRGVGLAARLVRHVCERCPTRYVEAFAVMGRVHPFFEKGGMTPRRAPGAAPDAPVYYLLDRNAI